MINRDRYTIEYRELRALVEDLLAPPPTADVDTIHEALQEHLRLHCGNCGELLDHHLRTMGERFCYSCVDPAPLRPGP
jgi:hypothetical protein